jgi:ribose 5-phosphate isomerase RpiB
VSKLAIACDHRGVALKNALVAHLRAAGHEVDDLGTNSEESVDYPDLRAPRPATTKTRFQETAAVSIANKRQGGTAPLASVPIAATARSREQRSATTETS